MADIDRSLNDEIRFLSKILETPRQGEQVNGDEDFSGWFLSRQLPELIEKEFKWFQYQYLQLLLLVSRANIIAKELQLWTTYDINLRISPSYLKPTERTLKNVFQWLVEVNRATSPIETWTSDEFEREFDKIRDRYESWKNSNVKKVRENLSGERKNLVGVANIFLTSLFYHTKLNYAVPIIGVNGEIVGTLNAVMDQTGLLPMERCDDFEVNSTVTTSISEMSSETEEPSLKLKMNSQNSLSDDGISDSVSLFSEKNERIMIKFSIKQIQIEPVSNVDQLLCRFNFINPKLDQTVISLKSEMDHGGKYSFDFEQEYTFSVDDQLMKQCLKKTISIEVYHYWNSIPMTIESRQGSLFNIKTWSLPWKDVRRYLQFSVEIQELNTLGQWLPVDVETAPGIVSGGIYRLKQGQTKRLALKLRTLPSPGAMPFQIDTIQSIEIGSIQRRKVDAPIQLDSYQEEELTTLQKNWIESIQQRKSKIEIEIGQLSDEKNESEKQREAILLEQLLRLAEEHNLAECPPVSSGLPGAPAGWSPPPTIEMHRPLIFLDIESNNSNTIAAQRATLVDEIDKTMVKIPLIQQDLEEMVFVAQWNPAIHDSTLLNELTSSDTIIYLLVRIVVLITQPIPMKFILRKRIAVTIGKTDAWWNTKILKNFLNHKAAKTTSVIYEIISRIPKYTHSNLRFEDKIYLLNAMEQRVIEASKIDSLLILDRLRQEVLLIENCSKQRTMKKSSSLPLIFPERIITTLNDRLHHRDGKNSISTMNRSVEILESQTANCTSPTTGIEQREQTNVDDKQDYSIGDRVVVNTGHRICNKHGRIRFIGKTHIKYGVWFGIELDEPIGKHNGSLDGIVYFQCSPQHGVFVRREKIRHLSSNDLLIHSNNNSALSNDD